MDIAVDRCRLEIRVRVRDRVHGAHGSPGSGIDVLMD